MNKTKIYAATYRCIDIKYIDIKYTDIKYIDIKYIDIKYLPPLSFHDM